ncbi:MAG TPA: SdrD B-like domain-containing protein, partial [Bacteroidia bacterium]|nr:SdrD B-like domain-containing protein [Bacteroidia bacterium]
MKTLKICLVGIFLSTSYSNAQSIVSITPNSVQPGQVLNALITGSGTSFLNGPGITNTRLNLGGSIIPSDSASINTIDNLHFTASFSIPSTGIPLGIYDLSVEVFDSVAGFPIIYNLSQAVTVGTIDGYITGQAYEDLNQNGVKDPAEQGLANVGIHNMPSNYSTLTDSLGNYSFSVANGNYTISCVDSSITDYLFSTSSPSYNVIINNNNSASNDFGLRRGLLSVAPSVVIQDETANFT